MKSHIPRKRFGQHFLSDQAIIEAIVGAVGTFPSKICSRFSKGQL